MRRERAARSHECPHPDIVADDRRLRFARMRALYCTGRSNKRNAGTRFKSIKTRVPYRSGFIDCSPARGARRCRIDGDTGNRRMYDGTGVAHATTMTRETRGDDGSVSAHATVAAQWTHLTPLSARSPHAPAASASARGSPLHCPSKPKNMRTPNGDIPANTDGATLSRKHA